MSSRSPSFRRSVFSTVRIETSEGDAMTIPTTILPSVSPVPQRVFGYISVRPTNRKSVLQEDDLSDVASFHGDAAAKRRVQAQIDRLGFQRLAESDLGFAVAGTKTQWESLSKSKLTTYERLLYTRGGRINKVTHVGFDGLDGAVPARILDHRDVDAL